jgi:uncharacterized protein YgiM (DUF1202 family)
MKGVIMMENTITNLTFAEENITEETNVEEVKTEEPEETLAPQPESVIGFVVDCKKLNVRKKPVVNDRNIIKTIDVDTEVTVIEPEKAKGEWYKVQLEDGVFGFCMKQFIAID